jgi:hypothetical protein
MSCNSKVNGYAGNMGGSPKSTTDGRDIGPNATNSGPKLQNTPLGKSSIAASATNKRK